MNEIERNFVKTFIARDRRERFLSFLANERKRHLILYKLAHSLIIDLDPRFVYEKDHLPTEVNDEWKAWGTTKSKQLCYVITYGDLDGKNVEFTQALSSTAFCHGSILILHPQKLAYYRTEQNNFNEAKHYILYHP